MGEFEHVVDDVGVRKFPRGSEHCIHVYLLNVCTLELRQTPHGIVVTTSAQ